MNGGVIDQETDRSATHGLEIWKDKNQTTTSTTKKIENKKKNRIIEVNNTSD
jgi:hypothetical protein